MFSCCYIISICILGVDDEPSQTIIEGIEFENKYETPKDDDNSWNDNNSDKTEDTQGNWGISPLNDSDISTSSTKRTLSPHIAANDNSDDASTSSASKKTKIG
jgi:hypothetical protein